MICEHTSFDLHYSPNIFILTDIRRVEVVVNNNDGGAHPWHMHGHQFQVIYRGATNTPLWDGSQPVSSVPVRRDVIMVNALSSVVWRFQANNPGVFLMHWFVSSIP